MKTWPKLVASILLCELVGLAATPFTINAIPTWYAALLKPPFSPPNWLFGPVWLSLYFLMGVAFYLIWRQDFHKGKVKVAVIFFIAQLGLNFLWSVLFFGLHSPLLGLIDILGLLVLIILTLRSFYHVYKPAAYLLVPYLLWVSFATILNVAIVLLN